VQVVYRRCGGLDIHRDTIVACVQVMKDGGGKDIRKREFPAHLKGLEQLRWWLMASKVESVAMESTGVYWKPVWHVLEGRFPLLLANPYHMRNIPGRKTDQKDAEWIADLHAHGLLKPSFVPRAEGQELRDLTRLRVKLKEEYNRIHNRIHKVLEDANIKLDMVASDVLGLTGRLIVRALVAGEQRVEWLADKAQGRLRERRAELRVVLRGHVTEHHRYLLQELLQEVETVERRIAGLEQRLQEKMQPYQPQIERLMTIPGVDLIVAWTLIAELGTDMTVFANADRAASWAGLVPGSYESAGKRKSSRTRKGNRWLRRMLCQSAWAVSHKKDCYLTAHFYRRAARGGVKKAIVATAHQILIIAYHILRDGTCYREQGGDFFDRLHPNKTQHRLTERLHRLGFEVLLKPRPQIGALPDAASVRRPGRPCKCAERGIDCKHKRK
jgi:transposase